jgi:phage-related protein
MARKIRFLGGSLETLRGFPARVKKEIGFSLNAEQFGERAINVMPLTGYGSSKVRQIICNHMGDTFRGVYTLQFEEIVYVLHVFRKKSKAGSKVPNEDRAILDQRLKQAKADWALNFGGQKEKAGERHRKS